jgi:hypothetical protein
MISCVICSRQPVISAKLKENIASTVGCEYELVVIDNSTNEYSIFSAYNEGVRCAKAYLLGKYILHPSVSNLMKLLNR